MHGCERVQPPLTCDLTAAIHKHPFDSYSIRVTALVGNKASPAEEVEFKPASESEGSCPPHTHTHKLVQMQTSALAADDGD